MALELPLKLRLENPFLGKRCCVGSDATPVQWELTTGATSLPGPNKSIEGSAGKTKFLGGGEILHQDEVELVDNAWEAPAATGCGGVIAFLVDPVVNAQLGKITAGNNTRDPHRDGRYRGRGGGRIMHRHRLPLTVASDHVVLPI